MTAFKYISICLTIAACLFAPCTILYADDEADDPQYAPVCGVPEGAMIIEGDILVPLDYYDRITAQGVFDTNWWPNGIVHFRFHSNVSETNQNRAIAAMDEIETVANVRFHLGSTSSDHILIQNSDRNSSFVGRKGGQQELNIRDWTSHYTIVHELLHALGMWHEHSRPDRDTYVTINWDNIEEDKKHNFDKHSNAPYYGPYDFDSVMHYPNWAFRLSSGYTIIVNEPWTDEWQTNIGQSERISSTDALTVQMMYPNVGDTFVDGSYTGSTQSGTFLRPYKTFTLGASQVGAGRRVIVQPGTYTGNSGVYSKSMTIRAPLGGVVLK